MSDEQNRPEHAKERTEAPPDANPLYARGRLETQWGDAGGQLHKINPDLFPEGGEGSVDAAIHAANEGADQAESAPSQGQVVEGEVTNPKPESAQIMMGGSYVQEVEGAGPSGAPLTEQPGEGEVADGEIVGGNLVIDSNPEHTPEERQANVEAAAADIEQGGTGAAGVEGSESEPEKMDYDAPETTVAALKDEIRKRNEGREDDDHISLTGHKDELIAALKADDRKQARAAKKAAEQG